MNFTKITGWLILAAGLSVMAWTLVSSYNIFTAKDSVPEFFEIPEEKITEVSASQDIQVQLEQVIGEQLKGIIPANSMTQMLNLTVWSVLAFILLSGGSKIGSLGIKLIKQ
jgi:hypothetical protein